MARFTLRHKLEHDRRPPAHLAHATAYTRTGKRDMTNRKPFRTKRMKAIAKRTAHKGDDGAFPGRLCRPSVHGVASLACDRRHR